LRAAGGARERIALTSVPDIARDAVALAELLSPEVESRNAG
jgi:hypothetical protein